MHLYKIYFLNNFVILMKSVFVNFKFHFIFSYIYLVSVSCSNSLFILHNVYTNILTLGAKILKELILNTIVKVFMT